STKAVKTEYLQYQPYIPMPHNKLPQIPDQISHKSPRTKTPILHTIPPLNISHIPLIISVASPHPNHPYPPNQY
uniref:molybdenum cofactor biosynthesis protein MoaE n=1 Tax=Staphylococcus saprophyticus TaxID=29385 RepID=UPI001642AE8A